MQDNIKRAPGTGHHLNSPSLTLLITIAVLGALAYAGFLFSPSNAGDLVAYIAVLIAETVLISQALVSLWTILSGGNNPRDFAYHAARRTLLQGFVQAGTRASLPLSLGREKVSVDVFVPVYGEDLAKVEATLAAARDIIGRHQTFVLDDGKSDELRTAASRLGVGYIRRPTNEGSKAGNINYALAHTSADYFVIFDADFVAKPNFLIETLPFFAQPNVAFVQTPQHYGNLHNTISRAAGYMQSVFYRLIQPGKNRFDAAFCVGTNVIFRRRAIDEVGGIYQQSKSEDIWTSLRLHELGYRSVFIGDVLAIGDAPDTIEAYMKQQLRWATGGFEILLRHNFLASRLSFDQKLQYLSTTTYYLHGVALLLLLMLPPMHILFDLSPVNLSIGFASWLVFYLAFYGMQIAVAFYTMGGFRFETIILAMVSFPVYLKALANVLRGRDVAWQATGNRAQAQSPFNYITPQLFIFGLLLITTAIGVWKSAYTGTLALSLFWNLINTSVFAAFIYLAVREQRALKSARATAPAETLPVPVMQTRKA